MAHLKYVKYMAFFRPSCGGKRTTFRVQIAEFGSRGSSFFSGSFWPLIFYIGLNCLFCTMLGREEEFKKLTSLLNSNAQFPAFLIIGPPKSGKSSLIKEVIVESLKIGTKSAQISCLSATIRIADIFESILTQLGDTSCMNCATFSDFVNRLNKLQCDKMVIVLKNADRLRSLDANLLPGLMKLNELILNR